ncbi:MAG: hypothetical protein JO222_02305 [Frankiales bacterium]|nr:hypothetical protein [Frankiales bacterium]
MVLLGAATAYGWWVWLPGYRPGLRAGERLGIDVSSHQGVIDWPTVAAHGIDFAYIKASEGGDYLDPKFAGNVAAARAAGLDTGAYHFFTLCTPGIVQARNFLAAASGSRTTLPPAVDLELAGNCSARPTTQQVQAQLDTFLALVERASGQRAVLYLGHDFTDRYAIRQMADHPLWVRRLVRRPTTPGWVYWQASSYARIAGIPGATDLDVERSP